MTDAFSDAASVSESRFPAAYSQGFAHVRVVSVANPEDPGPLAVGPLPVFPTGTEAPLAVRDPTDGPIGPAEKTAA